jgi:hypothetical protein
MKRKKTVASAEAADDCLKQAVEESKSELKKKSCRVEVVLRGE